MCGGGFLKVHTQQAVERVAELLFDMEVEETSVHGEVMADEWGNAARGAVGGTDSIAQRFDEIASVCISDELMGGARWLKGAAGLDETAQGFILQMMTAEMFDDDGAGGIAHRCRDGDRAKEAADAAPGADLTEATPEMGEGERVFLVIGMDEARVSSMAGPICSRKAGWM